MTTSFSGYKIREVWKNLIFIGSGTGWDALSPTQEPIQDGQGNSIGLAIWPTKLVASKPVELLGPVTLENGPRVTLSPTTTAIQFGFKSAAIVANQITVTDGTSSLRLRPHSLVINNKEFQIVPDQLPHDTFIQANEPISAFCPVNIVDGLLVNTDLQDATAFSSTNCLQGASCPMTTFGGVIANPSALRGDLWYALGLFSPLTNTWANGLKVVGVSPKDGLILIWPKAKLLRG